MKELHSKIMRGLLKQGMRKAKGPEPPDGTFANLIYKTLRNGWHYQVEWVYDTRFYPEAFVVVYAFAPPRGGCARGADYYLDNRKGAR